MTDNGRDQVPNGLHPDTHNRDQLVAAAEAAGIKVPSKAKKAYIHVALTLDPKAHSRAQLIAVARVEGVTHRAKANRAEIFDAIIEKRRQNLAEAAAEASPAVDTGHLPEDYEDADEQAANAEPQWADDGAAPAAPVATGRFGRIVAQVKAPVAGSAAAFGNLVAKVKSAGGKTRAKAADAVTWTKSKVDFRSRKFWLWAALVAIVVAGVVAYLVSELNDGSDNGSVATPAAEVDGAFAGLCDTDAEVDLTAMPVVGFKLEPGVTNYGYISPETATMVQNRAVNRFWGDDTALGCTSEAIEFVRSGIDQKRIDAARPGLAADDSAGRIAYYSEHPDEAAVLAEYLRDTMSECAAEMAELSEADLQDGLHVLTFTDTSYSDLIWVRLPAETALSGVDSLEVMRCTVGIVEGSDGLTQYFMYSEDFNTFVSAETPFGESIDYVPAVTEEAGTEPVQTTEEPEAPEVTETATEAADEAEQSGEPKDTTDDEAEQAGEPKDTTGDEGGQADEPPTTTVAPEPEPTTTTVAPEPEPTTTTVAPKPEPEVKDESKDEAKPETPAEEAEESTEAKPETPAEEAEESTEAKPETPAEETEQTTSGQPETPAEDGSQAPAVPVDTGNQGIIPGGGGCTGACGGPNEDGSNGGLPGNGPGSGGPGGCTGVCVGQGGNTGGDDGTGPGGTQGGCNVDCDGGGEPEPEQEPEETPEEEPEDDEDECPAPNTRDSYGNCKAAPREGAVGL